MELTAPIWDAIKCLCDCSAKHAALISHLEDNLQSLTDHWTLLQDRNQDVKLLLQQVESKAHMVRTREVGRWLQRVNDFEQTIQDIQKRGSTITRNKCLGKFCHKNGLSSYNLGKEVVKALDDVKGLMVEGQKFNGTNIAHELPRNLVEEMPIPKTVGMDLMLKNVWDSIEEENVGIIGLYGMGGAGKTTLMKKVNNELTTRRHDFTLVIWVVVSKDHNIGKILDDICKSVGIKWKEKSRDDKVMEIYNVMKQKKFLLFLDDVWERIDLDSIGVPLPDERNQSKVLFTTRYESVCDQIQAKKFEVKCLTEEEAFHLFCMKVGEEIINSEPTIRKMALELIQECKGLPLALIIVGRAMAGRKNSQSWKHAIKKLRSFHSEVKGMAEEVFFILKFSYDSLPNDIERKCFLYLALFPEDESISICDLILLWIGEGFLGKYDSIDDAFDHGQALVENLKLACLVEHHEENFIKVHDVIRDMTLWLLRDQDRNKNKILVQEEALKSIDGDNLIAERISIMMDSRRSFRTWNLPSCRHLVTLLMRNLCISGLTNIQFMREVKVLSLKGIENAITLPIEIGQLIHIEYLELSECSIEEKFPIDLKNLKRLKLFILRDIDFSIESIPLEVISCLKRLSVFEFTPNLFVELSTDSIEELYLEKLELLPHLEDICISLYTPSGLNKLLSSTKLQHCVRYVRATQVGRTTIDRPIILSVAKLERLEHLYCHGLPSGLEVSLVNHTDIFCKLCEVTINNCHSITHLTWLKYAPHLRTLKVYDCNLLEEVIMETEDNKDILANLEVMSLQSLPNLKSISKKRIVFS